MRKGNEHRWEKDPGRRLYGYLRKDIVTVHQEMKQAFQELLAQMVDSESEIIH
ncbi:hypothetical protein ACFOLK_16800 [Marinococcus halophilus]|uniref:hypothetical protein n=1 Tax=Marinococcus halophilus TaxID=1371 RepID=UPI00361251FB